MFKFSLQSDRQREHILKIFRSKWSQCTSLKPYMKGPQSVKRFGPTTISTFLISLVRECPSYPFGQDPNEQVFKLSGKAKLPWKLMILDSLDCPDFDICHRGSFMYLMKMLSFMFSDLPMDFIYKKWKNKEGQMSWISNAFEHPDVFSFANFAYTPVDMSCLKNPPVMRAEREVRWKSLELINILLLLSDDGFQDQVLKILEFPIQRLPDILLLGILQVNPWNDLKRDLIAKLLLILLNQHENLLSVLIYVWKRTELRAMVLEAMRKWHEEEGSHPFILNMLFSIAVDLEALQTILNGPPNKFAVEMAFTASQRQNLKLEEWLNQKIQEHGDQFIAEWLDFVFWRLAVTRFGRPDMYIGSPPPRTVELNNLNILLTCIQNFLTFKGTVSPAMQKDVSTAFLHLKVTRRLEFPPETVDINYKDPSLLC